MNEVAVKQLWDRICKAIKDGRYSPITINNITAGNSNQPCDQDTTSFNNFKKFLKIVTSRTTFYTDHAAPLKAIGIDLGRNQRTFEEKYDLGPELTLAERSLVTSLKYQGWVEEEEVQKCYDPNLQNPDFDYKGVPNKRQDEIKVCLSKKKFTERYPKPRTEDYYCIKNFKYYTETAALTKSMDDSRECERVFDKASNSTYLICYYKGIEQGDCVLLDTSMNKLRAGRWNCITDDSYFIGWQSAWDRNGRKYDLTGKTIFSYAQGSQGKNV